MMETARPGLSARPKVPECRARRTSGASKPGKLEIVDGTGGTRPVQQMKRPAPHVDVVGDAVSDEREARV